MESPPPQDLLPVFHEGEVALQRSVGMAERMAQIGGRIIRDRLPDEHRDFFARLPFVVAASIDSAGNVWPTLLSGNAGFVSTPDDRRIVIGALADADDPAAEGMRPEAPIGLLGIEFHSRRRNRVNGTIAAVGEDFLSVSVRQSFGNCPQFIRRRDAIPMDRAIRETRKEAIRTEGLSPRARAIVASADAFFVASYARRGGVREVDVSHRGGRRGFVRVARDGLITVPDFSGNSFFNTLGNFLVNPRAGLLFVDFESGDLLHLAGTARVIADSPEIAAFEGAQRLWTFRPERVVLRPHAAGLRWRAVEGGISRGTLATRTWDEAAKGAPGQAIGGSGQEGREHRA